MNRRGFIGAMLTAPAIVRSGVLMPVRRIWTPGNYSEVKAYPEIIYGSGVVGFESRSGWHHMDVNRATRVELDGTVYHVYSIQFPPVA